MRAWLDFFSQHFFLLMILIESLLFWLFSEDPSIEHEINQNQTNNRHEPDQPTSQSLTTIDYEHEQPNHHQQQLKQEQQQHEPEKPEQAKSNSDELNSQDDNGHWKIFQTSLSLTRPHTTSPYVQMMSRIWFLIAFHNSPRTRIKRITQKHDFFLTPPVPSYLSILVVKY